MPELKYVISGDEKGINESFKKVRANSAQTASQITKDFETARKASAKSAEGIMSDAKKLQQRNIKLDIASGDVSNGNSGATVSAENIKRNAAANAAYARSVRETTTAKVADTVVTKTQTVAQLDQVRSIQALTIQMQSYQRIAQTATDPARISLYNRKVQDTQSEITRLGNVGKAGFDNMGNAIQKNTTGLTKVWSGLRNIAAFIPGIGLAGLFAVGLEPLLKWVAGLGLFEKQINAAIEARNALNQVTLQGNQNAQAELTTLRINMKVVQDANAPLQKRKDLYEQIQKEYPSYFKNISFEQAAAGKTGSAYDRLTKSIMATARAKAYMDKITENASKILENDEKDKMLQEEILALKNKKAAADKRATDEIRRSQREGAGIRELVLADNLQGEINAKMKERVDLAKDTSKLTLQSIALERKATVDQGKGIVTPLNKPVLAKTDTELAAQKALQDKLDNLHDQALKSQLSDDQQEIQSVKLKYQEMREDVEAYYAKYKKLTVDSSNLEADEKAEIEAIRKRRREQEGKEEAERFKELLQQFQTYSEQRQQIISDANTAADELIKNGYDEKAKVAIERGKKEVAALDLENAEKLDSYKELFENIGEMSRKQTLDAIQEFRKQALAVGLPIAEIDKLIAKFNDLNNTAVGKKKSEELGQIVEELSRVASEFANINGAVAGIAGGLINAAKAYVQISKGLDDFKNSKTTEAKIGAGVGIAGAALAVVNSVIGYFKSLKKAKEEARKALAEFQSAAIQGEREYQALLRKRDLDMVARGKNSYRAIIAQLDLLKKQSPEIQKAYEKLFAALQGQSSVDSKGSRDGTWLRKAKTWDIMASLGGSDYAKLEKLYTEGRLKDQAKADFEALRALKKELEDAGLSVQELQEQLNQMLTGTSTSSLASSLADLFENGKFAAQDFASSFEEIMGNAIRNSFRLKVMEDAMQPFYEEFSSLFVSGTPTEDQINGLKAKYEALGLQLGNQFKELEKITGQSLSKNTGGGANSLKGGIQALTETTGTVLAGAVNGMRLAQLETLAVLKQQGSFNQQCVNMSVQKIQILTRIETNTLRTATNTNDALPHLEAISRNTSGSLGAQLRAAGKFGY